MSSLLPPKEELDQIAAKQDEKHRELMAKARIPREAAEHDAAELIQRNYRGYRERRQMKGMGLDASTRWVEAIKEARYRSATTPRSRRDTLQSLTERTSNDHNDYSNNDEEASSRRSNQAARQHWKRIGEIARRAGNDDGSSGSDADSTAPPSERQRRREQKLAAKREREKTAKMMDLQYFLEMVDQKHRYGSNLRAYHAEWKKADTHENFFFWLDYGEGRFIELPTVSRERLEREQVRYLSREERLNYLVKIDDEGRLCWAKNGERISTTVEWKDSINGIVPSTDETPAFRDAQGTMHRKASRSSSSSSSSSSSTSSSTDEPEAEHYINHDLHSSSPLRKIRHVSAATVLNHLLRRSVKPNSWIFVADTSFRLYVGIKQSGAFQHSSFLHGSRISAAGLIKVKDGQLRRLSPLSGHYRPPTANFRAFVHSLREHGVDMSRVSVSRSYAVLVGLEAYVRARRGVKGVASGVRTQGEKVVRPEVAREREEGERDKSKSAQKEREVLRVEGERRRKRAWSGRVAERLGLSHRGAGEADGGRGQDGTAAGACGAAVEDVERSTAAEASGATPAVDRPGQGAESGIAPEGSR